MNYRKLGNTDLKVSEIGMGCNKLGKSVFSYVSQKDSLRLLREALELGINTFDLAPTYSYGDSELLVGKAFKQQRKNIVLVTKAGRLSSSLAKYGKALRPLTHRMQKLFKPYKAKLKKKSVPRFDFSETWVKKSLKQSLKRLQTEYIDLFLLHNPSTEVLQKGEIFEVLEKCKKAGQIRHYGVSIDTLEEAMLSLQYPISALEITFNLLQQDMAHQLFAEKKAIENKGILIKTPFLRGMITSKKNLQTEYFEDEKAHQITKKMEALTFLNDNRKWNHTALQFILHHPKVSTVLCGTTSSVHLQDNLQYSESPSFTTEEWNKIQKIQERFPF